MNSVVHSSVDLGDDVKIESSNIDYNSKIGKGTKIINSVICLEVSIGENCIIKNCLISPGSKISNSVEIDEWFIPSKSKIETNL